VLFAVLLLLCLSTAQQCPDGTCTNFQTCCDMGSQWACCPYANAICCADKMHCCPSGYVCDSTHASCLRVTAASKVKVVPLVKTVATFVPLDCPSGTCPPTETCCNVGSGQFGCCPYPNADCCTDGQHCCPSEYTCDLSTGQCVKQFLDIQPAKLMKVNMRAKDCPSNTCTSGDTCCSLSSGGYGCCPYSKANCCNDGQHCCPSQYTCNIQTGQCDPATNSQFFAQPNVPIAKMITASPCSSSCNDGTCCPIGSDNFGCCPYSNGVCCDASHCCPEGYTCDSSRAACQIVASANISLAMITKLTP